MCVVVMQCNPSERLLTPSPAQRIRQTVCSVHSLVPNSVTKPRTGGARVGVPHTDIVTIHVVYMQPRTGECYTDLLLSYMYIQHDH